MSSAVKNLYVHFPFCRRKCTYCALHSRAGSTQSTRDQYVQGLASALIPTLERFELSGNEIKTVYFGGGSPALCDLEPLFASFKAGGIVPEEFTVELHPQDVATNLLARLRAGGVNRISLGVQSLDDSTLAKMGRGYGIQEAFAAFQLIRRYFDNAGIDLIVGYPGDPTSDWETLSQWGLQHCSVYSLILEPESRLYRQLHSGDSPQRMGHPDDDQVMDRLTKCANFLEKIGLKRYEISNYAVEGRECRHNLAVWRGEDYLGLGAGAYGRVRCWRTTNLGYPWGLSPTESRGLSPADGLSPERVERVDAIADLKERTLFRLRTREGLDALAFPEWRETLKKYCEEGLLRSATGDCPQVYWLTARGREVCDSILADLI